jgi:hypothetical protein
MAVRQQARAELGRLRRSIRLSVTDVPPGGTSYLLAAGFLPGHPVHLLIDGHALGTLTASNLGTVTYMIDPSLLRLAPGAHVIRLTSMLLTAASSFRSP